MTAPRGDTRLDVIGLTGAELLLPPDPQYLVNPERWEFFDVAYPPRRYAIGPFGTFVSVSGQINISFGDSFDAVTAKMINDTDYSFGTANFNPGSINIPDLATLALYFGAFEDGTGTTTINAEVQRYQPFNSTNHAFTSDRLNLTAAGTVPTCVVSQNDATGPSMVAATANPIARFGLADTSAVTVGQVFLIQTKGIYYVSALVANTSITLTALAGSPTTGTAPSTLTVLTGYYYATLAVATTRTNDLTLTLNSAPAGLALGMMPGAVSGSSTPLSRIGDVRITNIAGNVITVAGDSSWTQGDYAIGTGIVFGPPITSGQIWSKKSWDFFGGSYQAIAFELQCDFPTGNGAYDIRNINTAALYAAMPPDTPVGMWPAFWIYAALNFGVGIVPNGQATEMDIMETFWSFTMGPRSWTGGNVIKNAPNGDCNVYVRTAPGDSATNQGNNTGATSVLTFAAAMAGTLKFQMVWTPRRTYRYVNGVLVKVDDFNYLSQNFGQVGINLACGSLTSGFAANIMSPLNSQGLSNMKFGVRRMRTWVA